MIEIFPSITFFVISLAVLQILVHQNRFVLSGILAFGDRLLEKSFPSHSQFEQNKFAILRILFGVVMLYRSINIYVLLLPEEIRSEVGLFGLLNLIAAIFITLGFFTQWTFIFLMFVMWHLGDAVLSTGTLGNDVGAILSLLLFLTGAGRKISVDSIIIGRFDRARLPLLYLYGDSHQKNIALAKFAALLAYGSVCIYSLGMHLNDPAWTNGSAGPYLLTNSFMSSQYEFFETLFSSSSLAVELARISIWIMMFWYVLIIPSVLAGGLMRCYVITWGVLFFILSYSVLNLGSLAEIEFILWAALFWSKRGLSSNKSLAIFFDDRCNLCNKTVQTIRVLDIFARTKLLPVSENRQRLEQLSISQRDALENIYGITEPGSEVRSGYDFYLQLSKTLVLLWPLVPILLLGKYIKVGPWLYCAIATRRLQLFGYCKLAGAATPKYVVDSDQSTGWVLPALALHVFFLAGCYLTTLPLYYFGIVRQDNIAFSAAHLYGIAPINVFNRLDLRMAENWYVLRSTDPDQLVPLFTDAGSRLAMHKSDRVYFGNTLGFRRAIIGTHACVFDQHKDSIEYLSKVYLNLVDAPIGLRKFKYIQYHQSLPEEYAILDGQYKQDERKIVCTIEYDVKRQQ